MSWTIHIMSLHVSIKIKDTIKDCTLLLGSEMITCIIFDLYLLFNDYKIFTK